MPKGIVRVDQALKSVSFYEGVSCHDNMLQDMSVFFISCEQEEVVTLRAQLESYQVREAAWSWRIYQRPD